MARTNRVSLNGQSFTARAGERLLDAALGSGIDMPHDCRAGRCGSCLTRVRSGITLGGETRQPGTVYACQAMVFSDLDLEIEPLPPVVRVAARIAGLAEVADDIVELAIEPAKPITILPGQYCRFRFKGHPPRPFSPTAPLAALADEHYLRLHIKRVAGGRVTPQLGRQIRVGHALQIEGPFGHAFLRPRQPGRLVLVGSGTGFAPAWAVAAAALAENPRRSIVLLAASRQLAAFYMGPALGFASRFPGVVIRAVVEELAGPWQSFAAGRAIGHLPALEAGDTVYAAGGPALVNAVGDAAVAAGATFYADPFEPAGPGERSWIDSAREWIKAAS